MIVINSLSKSYVKGRNRTHALHNVSFTIQKGDVYGIIGLSGAGKSTLIRCLSRLIIPTSGQILFDGVDLAKMGKETLRSFRKKMGMIFQHFNLLSSRTVRENIAYPLEIANVSKEEQKIRVDELLKLVNLSNKADCYPSELSGGEKQRVGIARALANHPKVLFCDEATSALDPQTTKEILHLLQKIHQKLGITIVLITHEMSVIQQICNRVAVIEGGEMVENGLVEEIFSDPQHPTTKRFLAKSGHEIPPEFIQKNSPNRKLLRLRFKGKVASDPIISEIVRNYDVHANILLGWIDRLQTLSIGTLVIELTGHPEGIQKALDYLDTKKIHYEVIEHGP